MYILINNKPVDIFNINVSEVNHQLTNSYDLGGGYERMVSYDNIGKYFFTYSVKGDTNFSKYYDTAEEAQTKLDELLTLINYTLSTLPKITI